MIYKFIFNESCFHLYKVLYENVMTLLTNILSSYHIMTDLLRKLIKVQNLKKVIIQNYYHITYHHYM